MDENNNNNTNNEASFFLHNFLYLIQISNKIRKSLARAHSLAVEEEEKFRWFCSEFVMVLGDVYNAWDMIPLLGKD